MISEPGTDEELTQALLEGDFDFPVAGEEYSIKILHAAATLVKVVGVSTTEVHYQLSDAKSSKRYCLPKRHWKLFSGRGEIKRVYAR